MRVLLKLSGEQLGGDSGIGFDVNRATWIAQEVKAAQAAAHARGEQAEIAIMVGGGNLLRGGDLAAAEQGRAVQTGDKPRIQRVTADNAGMLGTVMNAILLRDVFAALDVPVWVYTKFDAPRAARPLTHWEATKKLSEGKVVILGGGTGNPFVTTDSGAVQLALELGCERVLKATKVDGVYTADPETHPDATKLDHVNYEEAVNNPDLRIMDKSALGAAGDAQLPIFVFKLLEDGNIARAVMGDASGTLVS